MARGDYFDVTIAGRDKPIRVLATRIGSKVSLDEGGELPAARGLPASPASPFVTVEELDKAGQPIRTFKFAKDAVIVIENGNAKAGK